MDNKDYGINLKLNISDFKSKMQEVKNMTKEYLSGKAKEIVAKPEVDTSEAEDAQSKLGKIIDNIKQKWDSLSTGKKIALVVGVLALVRAINRLKNATETAKKGVQKLKDLFNKLGQRITQNMNKGVSALKKFAVRLFGLQAIYRGLQKAVSAYLSYDSELSQSIQNTWAGFGSFLAPILEYLVSAFQRLLAYANAVMKALTGINFVARANAKAMQKTAGATSNANKQLAKFDEIENLDKNAGSGANVPQIEMPEVDTSGLEEYINHLKDLFQNGEFFQISFELGQKITEALDSIPWDEIQEKAGQIGKGIAEFLNGGISGTDWMVIGNTLAQGINTALYFMGSFINTFDWKAFGTSIGTFLYTSFNNIDWEYLGQTITSGIVGIFNTISSALQAVDWIQVANDIEEFVRNIDWEKIVSAGIEALGSALGGLMGIVTTLLYDAFTDIENYFIEKVDEAGGNVIKGFFKGIIDALANIGSWIYDNILSPFIEGFKNAFGIHSPSTVMLELGTYIVDGLINAIKSIPQKAIEIFNNFRASVRDKMTEIKEIARTKALDIVNGIKEKFENIPNWFKTKFTEAWNNVKNVFSSGGKIFDGIKAGIEKTFKSIVNKLIDGINKVVATPFKKINSMLNDIRNTEVLGAKPFKGLWGKNPIAVPKIPKLKVGTDEVLSEGLAYLHAGEKVVPADVTKGGYTNTNAQTDALLEVLINKVDDLAKRPNVFEVNGRQFAKATINDFKDEERRLGSSNVAIRRS